MRSNKGITLISLIIYLIVLSTVIGIIAMLTTSLSKGMRETQNLSDAPQGYTRITTYLTNDINAKKDKTKGTNGVQVDGNNTIKMHIKSDGTIHQYVLENEKIYYQVITSTGKKEKNITLCDKVTKATFNIENQKLKISMIIDRRAYTTSYSI